MTDVSALWDFGDPAGSEARFRAAAEAAEPAEAAVLLTQVARALGLQERYAEGHALLDSLDDPEAAEPEVAVRSTLERGRLLRSGGDAGGAAPLFTLAAALAAGAGLDALRIDALHMAALVAEGSERARLHEEALALARTATDRAARDWDASLLNNIGMDHADGGDHAAALAAFEEALAASERIGDAARTRVARWMVAWSLRHLGRRDEALALQRALKAELDAIGETDPYVDEELELLGGDQTRR